VTERKGYQTYRSFTQLDQWLTCGECYRLKYVERVREAPSVWTVGGTAFHSCAEWLLRGDLDLADESSARTVDAWESAWLLAMNEAVTKLPEGADPNPATWRAANRGTETPFWWRMEGPRMVGDFAAWWRRSGLDVAVSPDGEVMVEHELLVELGGVPVRVIPDALVIDEHNQFDVLDYKSGNAEKLKRKDPYQLAVYAAGIEVGLGIKATWGLFYGTRAAEAYPHDLTRFTAEQIGEAFARFDADELAGNYKPNPGRHLGLCQTKEKKQ
jgi:hypothetical protein